MIVRSEKEGFIICGIVATDTNVIFSTMLVSQVCCTHSHNIMTNVMKGHTY